MSNEILKAERELQSLNHQIANRIRAYFDQPDVVEEFRNIAWLRLGKTLTPEHQGWPKGGQQWFADFKREYIAQNTAEGIKPKAPSRNTASVKAFREMMS